MTFTVLSRSLWPSVLDELSAFKAETVIFPELTGRYPHVPVILCATKCDDESVSNGEDDGAGAPMAILM